MNFKSFLFNCTLTTSISISITWNNNAISSNYYSENTQYSDTTKFTSSINNAHSLLDSTISSEDNENDLLDLKNPEKISDFYKQRKTIIKYTNNIEIVVNSEKCAGREENIEVYVNSVKYEFNSVYAKEILSMNRSFHKFAPQALKSLSNIIDKKSQEKSSAIILSEHIEYAEGRSLITQTKNKKATNKLTKSIAKIRENNIHVEKIIVPIRQGETHWLTVVINFNGMNAASINVINSTNEAKNMSLQNIQDNYEHLLSIIKNSCQDLGIILDTNFYFSQYLQYGNMGCGITMSLFIEDFLKDKFKLSENEIFQESDYSGNQLIKDRSGRSSLVLEAIRRVQLAFEIEKEESYIHIMNLHD